MKRMIKMTLALFVLLMGIQMNPVSADTSISGERTIIKKNDEWKYHNEAPTNFPGEDWYTSTFDDSNWKTGNGVFGYKGEVKLDTGLSYGDSQNNKYPTYFFRKEIVVTQDDLDNNDQIELNFNIDDGAVFFINDKEVLRDNYKEGPIDYTAYASGLGSNGDTYKLKAVDLSSLKVGKNTVSVVVFQQRPDSSDVAFDLEMKVSTKVYDYTPTRINQTFNGDVTTNKSFTWHTSDEAGTDLRYIETDSKLALENGKYVTGESNKKSGLVGYSHKVLIEGLKENTNYMYQVGDKTNNVWSDVYTFSTGNSEDGINIGFITDSQGGSTYHYGLSSKTMKKTLEKLPNLDFFLQGGDLVDNSDVDSQWNDLFETGKDTWANNTIMTVSGNHDMHKQTFNDHFNYNYTAQSTVNGTYYSFDYDKSHFVMLNTNDASSAGLGSEQVEWLEKDLASARENGAEWIIVTMHKGTQTVANHIDDSDVVGMRAQLQPIFSKYNVDLVLQGHDHVYSRTVPLNGLVPEEDVESFNVQGTKTLNNPKGTTYLNGNSSGPKFYAPESDQKIADYGVYPDIKIQDRKQTFVTLEILEDKLTLNSYSFLADGDEEPKLLDSLVVIQNNNTELENKIASMPDNIVEDLELYKSIINDMNQFDYNARAALSVYPEYLKMLSQEGKSVRVTFDGVSILHESGYSLLNIETPVKDGYEFKHWENENTGKILSDKDVIVNEVRFKSVWEKKTVDIDGPGLGNPGIDKPNPILPDEDKQDTVKPIPPIFENDKNNVLPPTGIGNDKYGISLIMISLGSYITIKKRKNR